MKTNFSCPGCEQTLQASWFLNSNSTVTPINCKSCNRKLKLEKKAIALALIALVPAIGISLWAVPVALGKWNQEVPPALFFSLMALMAAIYLPLSWLLVVNFCSWEIIGDDSAGSNTSEKNIPTRSRILTEGLAWGVQSAVLWSLAMMIIYKDSFLSHFGVAVITFPLGGLIWAALRIYNLGTSTK